MAKTTSKLIDAVKKLPTYTAKRDWSHRFREDRPGDYAQLVELVDAWHSDPDVQARLRSRSSLVRFILANMEIGVGDTVLHKWIVSHVAEKAK